MKTMILIQIKAVLDDITGRLPDEFNMAELFAKTEEKTPYTVVALQECERMNTLLKEMRRSLKELDSGLKVSEIFYEIEYDLRGI